MWWPDHLHFCTELQAKTGWKVIAKYSFKLKLPLSTAIRGFGFQSCGSDGQELDLAKVTQQHRQQNSSFQPPQDGGPRALSWFRANLGERSDPKQLQISLHTHSLLNIPFHSHLRLLDYFAPSPEKQCQPSEREPCTGSGGFLLVFWIEFPAFLSIRKLYRSWDCQGLLFPHQISQGCWATCRKAQPEKWWQLHHNRQQGKQQNPVLTEW